MIDDIELADLRKKAAHILIVLATIRDAAHGLKGASANLRASAATAASALLEKAATSGNAAEIPELADKLTTEVRRTIEYLRLKVA